MPENVWDKLPNERDAAFSKFRYFRDLPPEKRSFEVVAKKFKCKVRGLQQLAQRWDWRERVAAWDRVVDASRQEAFIAEAVEVSKRQAQTAAKMQIALEYPIRELLKKVEAGKRLRICEGDLLKLAVRIPAAMKAAVEIERLALGLNTDKVTVQDTETEIEDRIAQQIAEQPEVAAVLSAALCKVESGSS